MLRFALGASLAEVGLDLELVHEFDFPEVLLRETELVIFLDDLKPSIR